MSQTEIRGLSNQGSNYVTARLHYAAQASITRLSEGRINRFYINGYPIILTVNRLKFPRFSGHCAIKMHFKNVILFYEFS